MQEQDESEASADAYVQKTIMLQPLDSLCSESDSHASSLAQLEKSVHFLIAVEEVCSRLAFELQCARAGLRHVLTCETYTDFIRVMDDFQTQDGGFGHLVVILGQPSWLSLMRSFVTCSRPFRVIDASMEGVGENSVRLLASCTDREFSETVKECLGRELGLGEAVKASSALTSASRASTIASEAFDSSPSGEASMA
ncbi:unnamed protein product [Symbiodinium sp. CCMP2456]|nr:unnamed protein product [Symbiodinium sp. CCMP2456]